MSRSFHRRAAPAAFLAALMGLVFATAASADPLEIRIAWTTVPGQLTPVLFAKTDQLRHEGTSYVVKHFHFAGSGPMVSALASGQIDIAQLAPSSLGFAIENAHINDIRVITDGYQDGVDGHYSSVFLVRKDSPISTVEALRGKVVAVNAFGGALDIAARAMLRRHHLEANRDYTMVEGAFPNLGSMLVEKKVDLISLVLPFSEVAEKSGNVRPLFHMKDALGTTQMLFNVARASFLSKNRAALADFFEDYVRAQRWFLDPANRTQAVQIVADFNKRPVSVFAPYLFTPEDFHRDPNARPNLAALQRNMEQLKALGFLKTDIDVKRHADLSFIDGAVKRLDTAKN
jgi:NitT/TauT family transport system substrate-binding protein